MRPVAIAFNAPLFITSGVTLKPTFKGCMFAYSSRSEVI